MTLEETFNVKSIKAKRQSFDRLIIPLLAIRCLSAILQLPKIETICEKEEDNGVKKKYLDALKKIKKVSGQTGCT